MQTTTVLTPGGQPAGVVPVQNVVIIPNYEAAPIWVNYASNTSFVLGVIQIVIGILCIVFNLTANAEHALMTSLGLGIWGGFFFILTGAFGTIAARRKTTCTIMSFMVLSILAVAIFVLPLLVYSSLVLSHGHEKHVYRDTNIAVAMNSLLLILSLFEVIIAIWSAILGCKTVCCGRRSQSGFVMQPAPVMMDMGGTQVMYTAGPPSTYPQTGNMGLQQGYPTSVSQSQQAMGVCSPQYEGASAPPPYAFSAPSATGESSATTPLFPDEEKKMAL